MFKDLSPHLSYVFLGRDETLLVINVADLNVQKVECLLDVLKRFQMSYWMDNCRHYWDPSRYLFTQNPTYA